MTELESQTFYPLSIVILSNYNGTSLVLLSVAGVAAIHKIKHHHWVIVTACGY